MTAPAKNRYLTLIFCFGLIFGLFFFSGGTIYAQGESEGESGDSIGARQEEDVAQAEEEAEQLTDLHQEDLAACEAEARGGGGGSPLGGGGSGSGFPSSGTGGTGIGLGDEQTTRAALLEAGWVINPVAANDCADLSYQEYRARNNGDRCTSVAGLPQHTIDRLAELREDVGPNSGVFMLTGGTEDGHATHGTGNNIVDLSTNNAALNRYIRTNAISSTQTSRGTIYYHSNGDQYLDEGNHWHVNFGGSATKQNQMQALAPTPKAGWAGVWQQVQLAFGPVVEAASFSHLIDLGDSLINLNTTSNAQLNQMIAGMDNLSLNQLFTGSSGSAVNGILDRLDFNTLNQTITRLNENSLNNIMSVVTNDTFSNISPMLIEDSFNNIFEGINRSTLNRVVSGFTDGNLSTVFSVLGEDAISDVFGSLTVGMADDLLGQLGQGAINNVLGNLGNFQLDNLINNLSPNSLNQVFSTLGGSTLNGVLENLGGGALNNILPNLGQIGLTNIFDNALPDALGTALEGVAPEIIEGAVGALPTSLAQELATNVPIVGEALGLADSVLGGALGGLAGGLYVPVVEQNGQLMQLTGSIDTTTQEVRDLSIQICTYLKQIARIQARYETARNQDANVSRIASSEIEKFRQAYFDWLKKGYVDNAGNQNSGPLFVVNTRIYWQESALEGENLARVEIKASQNPDKNEILEDLRNNDLSIEPTLTAQELQLLKQRSTAGNQAMARATDNIPILSNFVIKPVKRVFAFVSGNRLMAQGQNQTPASGVSAEAYWDAWKKLVEPRNNRLGSYLIAQDLVNAKRQEAVEIAKHETLASQGFLPVRTCAEWASEDPKVCKVWITNTPGILVKETAGAGLNSKLTQYEQADGMGDIVKGDEPNIREIIDLKPTIGPGGAPGPVSVSEPSDIPAAAEELRSTGGSGSGSTGNEDGNGSDSGSGNGEGTGEDTNTFRWESLIDYIDSIFGQDDEPEEEDSDLLQRIIAHYLENLANQEPLVSFKKKDRANSEILLYWFAPNATTCVSGNDWVNSESEVERAEGISLTQKGSLRLAPPAAGATYEITCTNNNGSVEKTITIPATTS